VGGVPGCKRLTYIGTYDSESWTAVVASDFEAVLCICCVVIANYDPDLNNPKFAPLGHGYADNNPEGIVKCATYDDVGTACPSYLIYVDHHTNREIVLAIRGLNLVRNADYKVWFPVVRCSLGPEQSRDLTARAQVLMDNCRCSMVATCTMACSRCRSIHGSCEMLKEGRLMLLLK
jgi:hypothetical protein